MLAAGLPSAGKVPARPGVLGPSCHLQSSRDRSSSFAPQAPTPRPRVGGGQTTLQPGVPERRPERGWNCIAERNPNAASVRVPPPSCTDIFGAPLNDPVCALLPCESQLPAPGQSNTKHLARAKPGSALPPPLWPAGKRPDTGAPGAFRAVGPANCWGLRTADWKGEQL